MTFHLPDDFVAESTTEFFLESSLSLSVTLDVNSMGSRPNPNYFSTKRLYKRIPSLTDDTTMKSDQTESLCNKSRGIVQSTEVY